MALLCSAGTHRVEHLRRGVYLLTVYGRCPNPTGHHRIEWVVGNRRAAFRRLEQLLAGAPPPAPSWRAAPPAALSEPPAAYAAGTRPPGAPLDLGRVVATTGALLAAAERGVQLVTLVQRHRAGDWGDVDADDARANAEALGRGLRVLSAYTAGDVVFWVLTEADRSATTVLLPSEY